MGSAANRSGGSGDEGPASRVRDSSAPVRLSLILRIWRNPGGEIWGQVVDPWRNDARSFGVRRRSFRCCGSTWREGESASLAPVPGCAVGR